MSLPEQIQKIKGFFSFYEAYLGTILHILLLLGIGSGGYYIGLESQKTGLLREDSGVTVFAPTSEALPTGRLNLNIDAESGTPPEGMAKEGRSTGTFVASSKGTKYHRIDCSSAKTIKEENRVYFDSEEAARKAGYGPAGNCPGLE